MIYFLLKENQPLVAALGLLIAFAGTCILTDKCSYLLPRDAGREFALEGKLSAGKPRGAGIIFILVFVASSFLFAPIDVESIIYLLLRCAIVIAMYFCPF